MCLIYDPRLYDPFQELCRYLCVRDLSTLACVSRKFYSDIEDFCEKICLRLRLKIEINNLLHRQPLLERDNTIRNKLIGSEYTYRWLFSIWNKFKRVRRRSIRYIWFAQAGNPKHIPIYFDRKLQRDIVEIKSVCWLHLTHMFSSVTPGHYRAALRMEVNDVSAGHHVAPGKIIVHWEDAGALHERKAEIMWNHWSLLRDSLKKTKCVNSNGAVLTNYDSDTGWFDFCLQDFKLTTTTDVHFEFNDIGWKSGMRWDYLELKSIDWDTT